MNRRRIALNIGLGAVVLALGVAGVVAVASPRSRATAQVATTKVVRGTLSATVTASGNVSSGITSDLTMPGTGGIVTDVLVKTGDQVSAGDPLVRIDDTAARQQLASARASLAAAQATMTTTTQGRTSAQKKSDSATVASAEQALKNAQSALDAAQESYDLVRSQQASLVSTAQKAEQSAHDALSTAQSGLAEAKAKLAATDPSDTAAVAALEAQISAFQTQISADQATVSSAQATLAAAQRTQDTQVLAARQAVTTQRGSRDAAKKSLAQAKATVAVNQQGPRSGAVASAQAQIDSAQVAVDQAKTAVANTVLRAPFSGKVSTVNAVVGQSSSAMSSSSSSTSAGSGLVTLVDTSGKTVTASIAEADATAVRVGQPATVELQASGVSMKGTVASIDPASTVTNNVVQYATKIALISPPAGVRDGQTASITITTASKPDTLSVATSAIAADGVQHYVLKMVNGTPTRTEVSIGMAGTTGTEITAGLNAGDEVVLSNTATSTTGNAFPAPGQSASR